MDLPALDWEGAAQDHRQVAALFRYAGSSAILVVLVRRQLPLNIDPGDENEDDNSFSFQISISYTDLMW